jgi:uncharacterized protein (DUF1330 family)
LAVYLVIEVEIKDEDTYREYVERVRPVVEEHGGRYLARGGEVTPVSGNWSPERVVLIEFPSALAVRRCFSSEEYTKLIHLRERSTEGRALIVEGEGREG